MTREASTPPTLEHVARVAGVSRATVSRVINGIRNVDPRIQEQVQQAIAATGYVPNRAARSLVTRRTGNIALVVSEASHHAFEGQFLGSVFTDPFFGRVLGGVMNQLRPQGIRLVLMAVDSPDTRTQLLEGHGVDGVILVSLNSEDPAPRLLVEAKIPTVLLGRPATPIPITYVDVAQRTGARLAVDHLVARGCRTVATISGPLDTAAGQDRMAGFREAMARHGHSWFPAVEGEFTRESGERGMAQLLAEQPDIDGVFVANDLMAFGALLALHHAGRRVPEDVAVVGFDDSSVAMTCRPPLTTVRHPLEDMAVEMTRLLLEQVEDPELPVKSVIFEPTLVQRESA